MIGGNGKAAAAGSAGNRASGCGIHGGVRVWVNRAIIA